MRIGKQDNAFTAIATSDEHSITVRGHDLVQVLKIFDQRRFGVVE